MKLKDLPEGLLKETTKYVRRLNIFSITLALIILLALSCEPTPPVTINTSEKLFEQCDIYYAPGASYLNRIEVVKLEGHKYYVFFDNSHLSVLHAETCPCKETKTQSISDSWLFN